MNTKVSITCDEILDTALRLGANKSHWEDLQLYEIADELNIGLVQLNECFPQKDGLTDALFDRADRYMLEKCDKTTMLRLTIRERLHLAIISWLESLAPHRVIVRQMLKYKLEFGHVHLQVLGLMRISRTVQWFRQVCICETTDAKRILEEVVLSSIFIMMFSYWLWDDSDEQQRTHSKLEKMLALAEKAAIRINKISPTKST